MRRLSKRVRQIRHWHALESCQLEDGDGQTVYVAYESASQKDPVMARRKPVPLRVAAVNRYESDVLLSKFVRLFRQRTVV